MRQRVILAKLGRRWLRRFPNDRNQRFVRNHFRKWCTDEELMAWPTEGFQMLASPKDYASHRIFFLGNYDPQMTNFIKAHVREGGVCWDVGAERGWFALLMGQIVGPRGNVDAFEAFSLTWTKLQANIALNKFGWVHPYNRAVSDRNGIMAFLPSSEVEVTVDHLRFSSGYGYLTSDSNPNSIEVEAITLDTHAEIQGIDHLDFIKMDIEGAEIAALRGGEKVIQRFQPIIAIEYNRAACRRAGSSWEELDHLLECYGYDRYTYSGSLRKLRLDEWRNCQDSEAVLNVYCLPRREH